MVFDGRSREVIDMAVKRLYDVWITAQRELQSPHLLQARLTEIEHKRKQGRVPLMNYVQAQVNAKQSTPIPTIIAEA